MWSVPAPIFVKAPALLLTPLTDSVVFASTTLSTALRDVLPSTVKPGISAVGPV